MRETGRPGRGERGRIAAQVRALLGEPAAAGSVQRSVPSPAETAWLPGEALDVGDRAARAPVRPASSASSSSAAPLRPSVSPLAQPASSALGVRWRPERRALTAVAAAVLVAGLITAWWVLSARPRQLAVQASPAATAESTVPTGTAGATSVTGPPDASGTRSASRSALAALVVDVAGKVRRPGVYRLAAGARVIDALRAAGGLRQGVSANSLNLAAQLQDGEQILVGVPGSPGGGAAGAMQPGAGAGAGGSGAGATGHVSLNAATLDQLETLPGVGPVLAQRILDWRTQHGSFTSIEQLDEVSGIGPAKFAQLRDAVTL